jgi:peptidoglycan biosynthesis protein MviN/MurJ (putative lipid II flippase)
MQMPPSASRKKVDDVMLLPIVIFMMSLSPVLLPALTTAYQVVANRSRNSRRVAQAVRGWAS